MFRFAVRKKWMAENPFSEMKGLAVRENRERDRFVARDEIASVLQACPNAQWRLLVTLSRFGGLRCPSEHLALRWGDVDWERSRITIHSAKTAHHEGKETRIVPLFPELRKPLEEVWEQAEPGSEHVIAICRDEAKIFGLGLNGSSVALASNRGRSFCRIFARRERPNSPLSSPDTSRPSGWATARWSLSGTTGKFAMPTSTKQPAKRSICAPVRTRKAPQATQANLKSPQETARCSIPKWGSGR